MIDFAQNVWKMWGFCKFGQKKYPSSKCWMMKMIIWFYLLIRFLLQSKPSSIWWFSNLPSPLKTSWWSWCWSLPPLLCPSLLPLFFVHDQEPMGEVILHQQSVKDWKLAGVKPWCFNTSVAKLTFLFCGGFASTISKGQGYIKEVFEVSNPFQRNASFKSH